MDLSLETRTEGDWTVIEVGGEIDVYTAPKLREALLSFPWSFPWFLPGV